MKSKISWFFGITIFTMCLACDENRKAQTNSKDHLTQVTDTLISNYWGKVITKKISTREVTVFEGKEGFAYNHHPQVTSYQGKLLATWSSGIYNEDEPGQVMLLSFSEDKGQTWSSPTPVFDKKQGKYNQLVYTSEGILVHQDTLIAFCGVNDLEAPFEVRQYPIFPTAPDGGKLPYQKIASTDHRTETKISVDGGRSWSESKIIIQNFIPNLKPVQTTSGRLIVPGNMSFPYTDGGPVNGTWKMSAVAGLPEHFTDAPRWFEVTQREIEAPFEFCEASLWQVDDHTLRAMLRTDQKRLAMTESYDNGESWTSPVLAGFTDCGSRFEFGRLPDGRFFGITTPKPKSVRTPMVLATSDDGVRFDSHYVIGNEPATKAHIPGRWKYGRYGYPSYHILNDKMYVIYSVNKEDIQICHFPLSELARIDDKVISAVF